MKCWICGGVAISREHKLKASDLRLMFGEVSPDKPLFIHTDVRRNTPIKGLGANLLQWNIRICSECNNKRTQPHDEAWRHLSEHLNTMKLESGKVIRLDKVFPGAVHRSMLNVHLYFVKLFGCAIAEYKIPVDLSGFARAIMEEKPHPLVHIAFGPPMTHRDQTFIGASDIKSAEKAGRSVFALWFYMLRMVTTKVMYAEPSETRNALIDSWHPQLVGKHLRIATV